MAETKIKWNRVCDHKYGTHYCVRDLSGKDVIVVHKKVFCGYWYVYVGEGQDEAEGFRFDYLWEAKAYAERQIHNGRVRLAVENKES